MGKSLAQNNGNDDVMTPLILAEAIVDYFHPVGRILEPCAGDGSFLKFMPDADWCEIKSGRDFLEFEPNEIYNWIITNPPYSKYRDFLNKSMDVSDNIVFLQLVNATWYKARLRDLNNHGFGIKEILIFDTPKEFPQFGFQMGCVHYQRDYCGDIRFNRLDYLELKKAKEETNDKL